MKQCILIGLLTGLLAAVVPLKAQVAPRDTDARKAGSRLELGRSATVRKPVGATKPGRFVLIQPPSNLGLDRPVALMKNRPVNEYYRSLLMAPRAAKAVVNSATVETVTASVSEARLAAEPELGDDNLLYTNDRIRVSNIYPNPASEFAEIDYKISGPVGEAKMLLLNVLGARVAEYGLESGEHKLRIATGEMATGYYLYQLSLDGKKVATKRLLVRHQ